MSNKPTDIPDKLFPAYSYRAYLREVTETARLVMDVDLGFGMMSKGRVFELNGVQYTPVSATADSRKELARRARVALMGSPSELLILSHCREGDSGCYAADVFYMSPSEDQGRVYLNALLANDGVPLQE
jgi:hypothetical protein